MLVSYSIHRRGEEYRRENYFKRIKKCWNPSRETIDLASFFVALNLLGEVADVPEARVAILADRDDGIVILPGQTSDLALRMGIYR